MTYKLRTHIKLLLSVAPLLCTECAYLHIKPVENSYVSSIDRNVSRVGMLDISGLTTVGLQAVETLSIQLYNDAEPMHFKTSMDIDQDSFIHGTDENGCTMNLILRDDPADGTQSIEGSVVDYVKKMVHQIRQNSLNEVIVVSGSPSSVKEFRDGASSHGISNTSEIVGSDNIVISAKKSVIDITI